MYLCGIKYTLYLDVAWRVHTEAKGAGHHHALETQQGTLLQTAIKTSKYSFLRLGAAL